MIFGNCDSLLLLSCWVLNALRTQQLNSKRESQLPKIINLHQNHPNPFNPITSLHYDLPEDGLVNITIYDMMGRIVKTLVNSSQTAV